MRKWLPMLLLVAACEPAAVARLTSAQWHECHLRFALATRADSLRLLTEGRYRWCDDYLADSAMAVRAALTRLGGTPD